MEKSIIQPIFSVSDFIATVNQTLDYAYPNIAIEGEVASFKVNQGKFVFFDLKDKTGSIGCFMSVWQLRMPIEDGMKIIVTAAPKMTPWGKFSLTVKSIRPSGEGAIKKSFDILKLKLENEGLFAIDRKRQLPKIPKHVAVITSTGSAGYADFVKIINDRWGGLKIDVAHVQVQGDVAPDQIINAIKYFNQQEKLPEVLVIIRGGGSADDLSAFNDELLARAVATSRIPTLVGVGHETDESLCDLVADVRASTPSNAAQILVPDRQEAIRLINSQIYSLLPLVLNAIDQKRRSLKLNIVGIVKDIDRSIDIQSAKINQIKNVISQLDPKTILNRGYALIRGDIKMGSIIEIETNKAILKAEVKNVIKK